MKDDRLCGPLTVEQLREMDGQPVRVVSDHVTEVLIGEESSGELGCVYQMIDGECFDAADIGVCVFRSQNRRPGIDT